MKRIITAVLALLMVTSCNAQNNNVETLRATSMKNDKSQKQNNMNKSIVIFFSHAGGMAYMPLIELAKEEANKGELPPYEGTAPDLSQYDTVFIGGPVWWGTYPQVMFTLFKDINLDGKTVIPFTTHEGSGLASCASDVKKAFPKAKVTGEFSIYGHEVRTGKAKVEKWLKSL